MANARRILVALLLTVVSGFAHAADEENDRLLTMKCQYADYTAFQFEEVSIVQGDADGAAPASVRTFQRGSRETQQTVYRVKPGEFAECIFPSGKRVRVKVGEGTPRGYGMCGGNPEVFTSIWVDGRKVLSSLWFAGHCIESNDASSFRLQVSSGRVTRCQSASWPNAVDRAPNPAVSVPPTSRALSACVEFPAVARYPVDRIEYPPRDARSPAAGTVELIRGHHPVCSLVAKAMVANAADEGVPLALPRPEQEETVADLPNELAGSTESMFDFDNNGTLDLVFSRSFENTYMHGAVLLAQLGTSHRKLNGTGSPLGPDSIMVPCQIGEGSHDATTCPPFSQKHDDAGFAVRSRRGEPSVSFRARYTEVAPFRFRGSTYLDVVSHSEDTRQFVAVLKPLPNKKFQQTCLLRRVPENF